MATRQSSTWKILQFSWRLYREAERLAKLLLPGRIPTEAEWGILMGLASITLRRS